MEIDDPGHHTSRGAAKNVEFSLFKHECSKCGEVHMCNDNMARILHPGILIESQDGEEASYFCACRGLKANFPCPKCLVPKMKLDCITETFELRTSENMCSVLQKVSQASSKVTKEKILQGYGLHNINHFLWDFQFSDPYAASSYDTLHSDDLGKWGKHLWNLVLEILEHTKRCMTERQLQHLEDVIKDYEKYCKKVSMLYKKNFSFFKQHYITHVISDIKNKGTTDNMLTCPGEGFQQEASQAYKQTNKKKVKKQMVKIDENQEVIAAIHMAIEKYNESTMVHPSEPEDGEESSAGNEVHWTFGSCSGYEDLRYEDQIYVKSFKCLYINYQSVEDWTESHDILRCNPSFNEHEWYDCVLVNSDSNGTLVARLRSLKEIDMALVHAFNDHTWKPNTMWKNCQIFNEDSNSSFLLMDYIIHGALMCPAFDTVDGDMFLRINCLP
ncbi:hypothetical protein BDQ17DRAFT_1517813 [Cyathus striatus]|nr:hypothetical protein BDQ17DRAFT_1517813 [Cyathus striatus]